MTTSKPKLFISQSLIKEFLHKGNERDLVCTRKVYAKYVLGLRTEPTEANAKGLCFEDLCCDTDVNHIPLPRHAKTRKLTISSNRLMVQANIFKEWIRDREGIVNETNSQITIYKRWDKDPNVILSGKLDIFPVILLNKETGEYEIVIIDIKYTGNITSNFGKFGWGNVEFMDHTQAIMYLYLVRNIDYDLNDQINPGNVLKELTALIKNHLDHGSCKFKYYVADDKPSYASDVFNYTLKPGDFNDLHESIRKVVAKLRIANDEKWPALPSSIQCLGGPRDSIFPCPFTNCSFRKQERDI